MITQEYFKPIEFAQFIGVDRLTVYRWIQSGRIPKAAVLRMPGKASAIRINKEKAIKAIGGGKR